MGSNETTLENTRGTGGGSGGSNEKKNPPLPVSPPQCNPTEQAWK